MRTRLFEYLYWLVICLWFAANVAWLVTAKRPRLDRISALIWILVAYSLWRRWRRAQRAGGAGDPGA